MMTNIKNVYVLIDDIKAIYYRYYTEDCTGYLVIKYRFEDEETKIPVVDFGEFNELAEGLCDRINMMKA